MTLGEAAYVGLVDDCVIPWTGSAAAISGPIEVRVNHRAFRHERRAVTLVKRNIVGGFHLIAKYSRVPFQFAEVRPCIGIEQQLVRVKPVPSIGLIRSMYPVSVNGSWRYSR